MSLIPLYIRELSPKQIAGSLGVFTQLFVLIGVVFAYGIGIILLKAGVPEGIMWRIIFILNLVPIIIIIACILIKFIPESPNSLIINGDMEEAKRVIGLFHKE